jgi:hypothetical protein
MTLYFSAISIREEGRVPGSRVLIGFYAYYDIDMRKSYDIADKEE